MAAFQQLLDDPTCDGAALTAGLEAAFEDYFGAPWHAVATQSGSAAQMLLLRAYGIGPGDEVITAPNSDLATTSSISHTGASFVLADVEPGTFNIDPAAVEAAITERTRAIVPVHMYGLPARMAELRRIAERHNLLLLEDATLALGATYRHRRVGTLGEGSFFSFAPRKILGGIGSGGMILTRDPQVAQTLRRLRGYGLDPQDQDIPINERHSRELGLHVVEGFNLRLDGIQAAITHAKFRRVDEWAELRRSAADRYSRLLAGVTGLELPTPLPDSLPAWRNYTVLTENRNALRAHLAEHGVTTGTLYSPPVHLQPVYAGRGYSTGDFPVAEAQSSRLLSLPIFPGITGQQQQVISDLIHEFFQHS